MSDKSFISQADSDIVTDYFDAAADMIKYDGGEKEYLDAKDRLERLIVGLRGRIVELEARNATPEQFLRQVITDSEEWECHEDAADRLAALARQAKAILGDNK